MRRCSGIEVAYGRQPGGLHDFLARTRHLSSDPAAKNERLREHFLNPDRFDVWAAQYRETCTANRVAMKSDVGRMDRINPKACPP